jgi:hypothetical protein
MIDAHDSAHRPERTLRHYMEQQAQRFLGDRVVVGATISFPEMASARLALIPLPPIDHAALDRHLRTTLLAACHASSLFQAGNAFIYSW